MKNLGNLMKQAQAMQARMAEMQSRMEETEHTGSAGGGLVTVVLTGKTDMKAVKIDKSLLADGDVGVLEDLIVAAHADAKSKAAAAMEAEMKALTGGLSLPPGLSLPF